MHPSQIQAILAMIDGMTAQLQGLRQIVGAGYRTPQPQQRRPPQNDQYLNDQEEQLLEQAIGVGPQGQQAQQWAQQQAQAQQMQQQPAWNPQQQPFQGFQQPIQQPGGQVGQYGQPFAQPVAQVPFQQPQRPFHMPNNMDQAAGPGQEAFPPPMPPNQNAIARLFQSAAQQGVMDPSFLQQQG